MGLKSAFGGIVLQNSFLSWGELGGSFWYGGSAASFLLVDVQHATARGGGAREISLASRLRFCAVAVSSTSSLMILEISFGICSDCTGPVPEVDPIRGTKDRRS